MKSEEYKFLIFAFKIDEGLSDGIIESYATDSQMIDIGLDPSKDMDIKIADNIDDYNIVSINLQGKYKDKYVGHNRDLSIRKIFGEL